MVGVTVNRIDDGIVSDMRTTRSTVSCVAVTGMLATVPTSTAGAHRRP